MHMRASLDFNTYNANLVHFVCLGIKIYPLISTADSLQLSTVAWNGQTRLNGMLRLFFPLYSLNEWGKKT